MADEWQTQEFRQTVIARITDILQSTGQDVRNATAMENQFFRKSRSKQEYLSSVAKLFMHFKDMQRGRPQQPPQPNPDMQQQNMAQDPLNALQNLASQGNRPQMMSMQNAPVGPVPASNLLQTLNQQRPGQQQMQQQMQGIRVQMPGGVGVVGGPGGPAGVGGPNGNDASGPGGPQQMPGNMGNAAGGSGNMQMNAMNNMQQGQMIGGNAQQMSGGMPGQMNQMQANAPGGGGGSGPVGMAPNAQAGPGVSGPGGGGAGPMQQNAGGGPMNVNAMNVQQMQQMNQNQMGMNMNHPQMNQMMNARMPVGGPNASPQLMQGMQQNSSGPMQANNVPGNATGGGPQAQLVGMPNANNSQPNAPNQMLNMPGNIQQRPNTPLQQGGQMFAGNRGIVGQQAFLRQSPSPSAAGAAAQQQQQQQQQQLAQQQQAQQQQQQQQQQQIVPPNQQQSQGPQLPTPQMIPSPALVPSSSPQMSNLMQNQQQRNIRQQSPSANLNTPGQVSQNSPFNPHEDQLYREKYKQLTKYIEPLKRMVAKIGNDDAEKITKMSKLLQILCNPSERVPLETLLKCEKALEKMEPCLFSGQQFKSSNPLMEAINTTIQSPVCNHTLYRTFRPSLEMLFGTNISAPPPPAKIPRRTEESTTSQLKIPHVLQGEVARLDARFKITLDTGAKNNQKSIKIICCLEDRRLPSVPPITVNIPEEYPFSSPDCTVAEKDYARTAFLKMVYNTLMARIAKLPKLHSLSHLLDTWEMSVRQSCSPNARAECDFSSVYTAAVF